MIAWHRKILRWTLLGGAFVSVLATTGCLSADDKSSVSRDPAGVPTLASTGPTNIGMAADPTVLSAPNAVQSDPVPPTVNVYGEFDGKQRGPAVAHGTGGFAQHTFLDEGYDSDVSLDPTGKWMVFTSTRDSDHPNIYLQRVDGESVIQLTDDTANYAFPTFSPDGKQIAFCSTRAGEWDIYTMDSDGKNIVQITNDPMQHIHPSFSPDGNRLVYCCLGGRSGQWELWTVDLTTSEKRMIGFGLFPTWSPAKDADRIAFQRARQRGSRWFSLWTLDLADGEARRVTEVAVSSNAAIVCPSWSPDGREIAFATIAEPNNSTPDRPLGQQDIWTINCDGTGRHRVTDGVGLNLSPCWAANNQIYFVSDRGGAECIWSAGVEAPSEPSRLASEPSAPPQAQAQAPAQDKSSDKSSGTDVIGTTTITGGD